MGRQQANVNSLVSNMNINCSSFAIEERASPVCGTDRQTYSSVCGLKSAACSMMRRQGGNKKTFMGNKSKEPDFESYRSILEEFRMQ